MQPTLGLLLSVALFLGLVACVGAGWAQFFRSAPRIPVPGWRSRLALCGFGLASASALLIVGSGLYAWAIGGFRFYDPLLLRIYRSGFLLSFSGLLASGFGIGAMRRWGIVLSSVTLFLWFAFAMGE